MAWPRLLLLGAALATALSLATPAPAAEPLRTPAAELPRAHLSIVGALGDTTLYQRFEEPFWRKELPAASQGRVTAEISPSTALAVSQLEILRLVKLGVTPFATVSLSGVSDESPELEGLNLAGFMADADAYRRVVRAYRPEVERVLMERYGARLLALYSYPAQVLFCARPFSGVKDLKGLLIRTSSASQVDLLESLGATTINLPYRGLTSAMRSRVADCAVTGAISGYLNGLHEVASHVWAPPLGWAPVVFLVNDAYWRRLDPEIQRLLSEKLTDLSERVWLTVAAETESGLSCVVGRGPCPDGGRSRLRLVAASDADRARLAQAAQQAALPRWAERCGAVCYDRWRQAVGLDGVEGR